MDKKKTVNTNKNPQAQIQNNAQSYKNQDIESMLKGLWNILHNLIMIMIISELSMYVL